ncbi:MAG: GIY-YIG nuclease family protein [Candidatus Moraniibacteriota bacterium]
MITKEKILEEIKRLAKENGGVPLGFSRFEQETGIIPYDWQKYWARFGDAQKDAGYLPNKLQGAHSDEFLIEKLIVLMRKMGKFPTALEIRVERNNDPELPHHHTFQRLGTKDQLAAKIIDYCKEKTGYDDIMKLCQTVFKKSVTRHINDVGTSFGEVYLFKSGRYYKIGKTNDTVRRGSELRIQLPEDLDLIHSIKTDDPSGIEAYWHKRFDSKRMNGEWFNLNSSDLKAFQRWRRIC